MSGVLLEKSIDKNPDTLAFVIGNGESRQGFDLNKIAGFNNYACNLSALDFDSQQAVACDRVILNALADRGYAQSVWTRASLCNLPLQLKLASLPPLPYKGDHKYDQQIHWGSGLNAVLTACDHGHNMLLMLGFDLFGSGASLDKINNIYKNSPGYKDSDARPVNPVHWIHQFQKLFKLYPLTSFVFIKREDYPRAPWDEFPNVYFDNYENLHNYIKDFDLV